MTATQTIHFDPTKGALTVQLLCGNAQPGSYDVSVLDPSMLNVLEHWSGDFQSPTSDRHTIKTPLAQLDGAYIRLTSEVALLPPYNTATVFVTVTQNGQKLGAPSDSETSTASSVEVDVTFALSATPAGKPG
jgi:hypothetical protein